MKGEDNRVADHLSRILINHEKTPLCETFPDEQLMNVTQIPWYADIVNYLVTDQLPSHWTKQEKNKFIQRLSTLFGMTLIYLNTVLIRSLGDVSQNMNNKASSLFAIIMHVEVILDLTRQLLKFYNVVFIGRRYLTIVIYIVQLVIDVNDWEALGREI